MKCVAILCCLGFLLVQTCQSANIVVYVPSPFHSHQTAFKPLWLELAKRGHKITLIQPTAIIENNENITYILLDKTYDIIDKYKPFDGMVESQFRLNAMMSAIYSITEMIEYQLSHPGVQEFIRDVKRGEKKVDLFFTEYIASVGFALGRKLNAPTIGIISMDAIIPGHMSVGNPTHPVMYPDRHLPFTPPTTITERLTNSLLWFMFKVANDFIIVPAQQTITAKHLGEVGPLDEVMKNVSLLFTNANPLFHVVRPLGPKTVNIGGGVHLLEPRPLDKDLQDYLDNAKNGVIYFSLGSIIKSGQLSNNTKKIILETFSQLPCNVLLKFNEEVLEIPKNVKVMKWIPQRDILRHKNVKLFITHGGLQSVEEAIFSYVPMIALPFYGDQHSNARVVEARGFGLTLDPKKLDVATFKAAILEILDNSRYRERIKESAGLVMDQPMTGLQKAVWWTEYVLRHGATEHFRDASVDTPWYQYLLLDVISFVLVITVIGIYVFIKALQLLKWVVRMLYNILIKKNKKKTS